MAAYYHPENDDGRVNQPGDSKIREWVMISWWAIKVEITR